MRGVAQAGASQGNVNRGCKVSSGGGEEEGGGETEPGEGGDSWDDLEAQLHGASQGRARVSKGGSCRHLERRARPEPCAGDDRGREWDWLREPGERPVCPETGSCPR